MNAIEKALTKVFGSANERLLKKLWPVVARINALEAETKRLSDEELRAKTEGFKARLARRLEGSEELSPEARKQLEREALDEVLPEAFACVREASVRSTEHAPLRRAVDRRDDPAPRNDRRDAHRRR